jgi:hypothetical protein
MALEALTRLVAHTLDKVDDALFELADRAENNALQTRYFDAMRDARLRRAGVETAFKARFLEGFERRPAPRGQGRAGETGGGTLGLVENDELEVTLAVKGMISKVRSACEEDLFELDRRIGYLLGDSEQDGWHNPLGPERVCTAFREACDTLDSSLTLRLLVLKLFDKHALGELDALYRALNQHLVAQNVLPGLERPALGHPVVRPQRATPGGRAAHQAPAGPLEPDVVAFLQEVAAVARPGMHLALPDSRADGYTAVVSALTALQHGEGTPGLPGLAMDPELVAAGTVNVLRELRSQGMTRSLNQVDDLMLEVVTLLFDFILDDAAIPDALKALIGRLQIPMLKVAILDKALFARKTHPARRLLNAMASAAVGWDPGRHAGDELYRAIERVVQRVVAEFDQNAELFDELLEEFEGFLARQEDGAQQRADISAKILQGRERLEQAKGSADAELRRALAVQEVPPVVREFLDRHWRNLLVVTHNRDGEDSEAWRSRVQMMDTLVWSVLPKRSPPERRELLAALPTFARSLSHAIQVVGMPDDDRDAFLAELSRCHTAAIRGEPGPGVLAPPRPDAVGTAAGQENRPEEPGRSGEDDAGVAATTAAAGEAPEPVADAAPARDADDVTQRVPEPTSELEEIVLEGAATRARVEPPTPPAAPERDTHLEAAEQLPMGSWVEFTSVDGVRTRARLTWVSSVTGVYLFTDRKGIKAAERTPAGLAAEFRRGSARIMESVPLFDRALSQLVRGLRGKSATASP